MREVTSPTSPPPDRRSPDPYRHLEAPLRRLAVTHPDEPRRTALRNELAIAFGPVTRRVAGRFAGRDQPREDLEQVATIGMLKALDRFRLLAGRDPIPVFVGYAALTISGEIRRHLRDHTWPVHVPRPLKDIQVRLVRVAEEHLLDHGRSPRPSELAQRLGVDLELVVDALHAGAARRPGSIDAAIGDTEDRLADRLAHRDVALANVEIRRELSLAMRRLSDRDAWVVVMRFVDDRTQAEIARELGISQMQVSRLLSRSLHTLRTHLTGRASAVEVEPAP